MNSGSASYIKIPDNTSENPYGNTEEGDLSRLLVNNTQGTVIEMIDLMDSDLTVKKFLRCPPSSTPPSIVDKPSDFELDFTEGNPNDLQDLDYTGEWQEEQREVDVEIARQEAIWDSLKLEGIDISPKEMGIWARMLSKMKEGDFKFPINEVEVLEKGEMVELIIDEFESFRIVKIRAKDKEEYAMCVVEFVMKNPKNKDLIDKKLSASYLIKLPLKEGEKLLLFNKKWQENKEKRNIDKYVIRRIYLNKERSVLKGVLDKITS